MVMHISALGGHILDRMGYVPLFLYNLKNDLCPLTYTLWGSINIRNFKAMDVENLQTAINRALRKSLSARWLGIERLISKWENKNISDV